MEQTIQYNMKGYLSFWILQIISELGTIIGSFVIIIWLTLETKSALVLGISTFLTLGCFFIVIMFAGVYVDRWSRKKIMGIVDILQGFFTLLMIYLFYINAIKVWMVLIILAIRSILQAFHVPALESIIQVCIPPKHLARINSMTYLAQSIQIIVGPLAAGFLLGAFLWPIDQILLFDALPYFPAALAILLIRVPSVKTESVKKTSFRKEFSDGFTFLYDHKGLLSLVSAITTNNALVSSTYNVLLSLLILNIYNASQTEYGIISSIAGIGSMLGGVLMFTWGGFKRNTVGVMFGLYLTTIGALIMPLALGSTYWLIIVCFGAFINGFTLPMINISGQTIWQKVIPKEIYGRVFSVLLFIAQGLIPIFSLLIGIVAEFYGVIFVWTVACIIELIILTYIWFFTGFPYIEKQLGIANQETNEDNSSKKLDDKTIPSNILD